MDYDWDDYRHEVPGTRPIRYFDSLLDFNTQAVRRRFERTRFDQGEFMTKFLVKFISMIEQKENGSFPSRATAHKQD